MWGRSGLDMSARAPSRRIAPATAAVEAAPRAGNALDLVMLDSGILGRIAHLAASEEPIDRIFGAYLSRASDLYEFVAVEADREGQSFTGAAARALRNRYLREIDKMITAETPELPKKRTQSAVD